MGKGTHGVMPGAPSDVQGLRSDLAGWLRSQGNGGGTPGNAGGAAERDFENFFQQQRAKIAGMPGGANMVQQFDAQKDRMRSQYVQQNGGAGADFSNIFGKPADPFKPVTAQGVQIGNVAQQPGTKIGPVGVANYDPITAGAAAKGDPAAVARSAQLQRDPAFNSIMDMIVKKSQGGQLGSIANAGNAASTVGMVQSMDQLDNSFFKNNVMSPYRDLFKQTRNESLAGAKEAAGNLTGSGFANALGTTVNRSIAQENAALSDILTQLGQFEVGRQQQVADREQNRLISNAGFDTQAGIATAGNQTQGNIAGLSQLGDLTRLFSNESIDAANRADKVGMFNSAEINKVMMDLLGRQDNMSQFNTNQVNQSRTQQAMENARNETQRAIDQGRITSAEAQNFYNQQVNLAMRQGELDQNNNQFNTTQLNTGGMFNNQQANNFSMQNADNFLRMIMGMATTGVGPDQQTYKPGGWDAFAQIIPFLGQLGGAYMGGRNQGGKK